VSIHEFSGVVNNYGARKVPFLFIVDFEMQRPLVFEVRELSSDRVLFNVDGVANYANADRERKRIKLAAFPPSFSDYKTKFDRVWSSLLYGDSYLTNLTIKSEVEAPCSLREIFFMSAAKYKLWYDERFLVFSPETFVRIANGSIYSYPMKGTIDASIPGAKEKILSDAKEMAEHVTIVDLIRNDLSTVADNVTVTKFRYVEEIRTMQKNLLQVSSEIQGKLSQGYEERLGDILVALLPAGSVSGAPKRKTIDIISAAEKEQRGYYTGVFGLYDGNTLDSGVMIRFLEKDGDKMYYRSGGGITVQSVAENEYQEAIDKIYVPFD
jgi:para-aminobenzoate synthetase component 1